MHRTFLAAALMLLVSPAVAQHHGHHPPGAPPTGAHATPYAGFQKREIKALSPEQIADLRAGRGMGLALAAEMNAHPGPMHVLEHAERLQLTAAQRQTMDGLMQGMRRDAIAAGEVLIAAEAELDRLFASATIDEARLTAQIRTVSNAQGEVRRIHLTTHIAARAALTAEQIILYSKLRGYTAN
ncbi:MAG: Spy/CpxP family protein refolding chaperone [Bosea sp. (in: a-proteobacteria)]